MPERLKDIYTTWTDSLISARISSPDLRSRLDQIWAKAGQMLPRATLSGWVDHSGDHAMRVLRNLDMLIPDYVMETINEQEAFVFLAGTLLHDIGMVPEENASVDAVTLARIRQTHGQRSADFIRHNFSDLIRADFLLNQICEIAKNHHGPFDPVPLSPAYDLRADALWVRLADELDFGPSRAPEWLLEYLKPDPDSMKHWATHNKLQSPQVDLELFRIQINGWVSSDAFVRKLRDEFEAFQRQDLQKNFLSRGTTAKNRTFLIWDQTKLEVKPGEDDKHGLEVRPSSFTVDMFFEAGRYLYNMGKYDLAITFFEDGLHRTGNHWSDSPACYFFYHYLKSLHSLGEHQKAVQMGQEYLLTSPSQELTASITMANGHGLWKLNQFAEARRYLTESANEHYHKLAGSSEKFKIDEADACVLNALTYLEEFRSVGSGECLEEGEKWILRAEKLFEEYERSNPGRPESHYKGRYWGTKAFFLIARMDTTPGKKPPVAWHEAERLANLAQGGDDHANRNPYGTMCGEYCCAAIYYHRYLYSSNRMDARQALLKAAQMVKDVMEMYSHIFGPSLQVYRTWGKIQYLARKVCEELSEDLRDDFSCPVDMSAEPAEIFSSLN